MNYRMLTQGELSECRAGNEFWHDPDAIQRKFIEVNKLDACECQKKVGPASPLGKIQVRVLNQLYRMGSWNPNSIGRGVSYQAPYTQAARKLAERGFCIEQAGIFVITEEGRQEAVRRRMV